MGDDWLRLWRTIGTNGGLRHLPAMPCSAGLDWLCASAGPPRDLRDHKPAVFAPPPDDAARPSVPAAKWRKRDIISYLLAFIVVEQIMIAGIVWYHTNPIAVAAYAARADLRILNDAEHKAMGEESSSYQSCENRRFLLPYRGVMCIDRVFASESFPCEGEHCPDVFTGAIHYWAPNSILNPFTGYYYERYTREGYWLFNVIDRKVLERVK